MSAWASGPPLLLFLLTRFASQFFLFSCVMVIQFGHEGLLVGEQLTRTLLDSTTGPPAAPDVRVLRAQTPAITGAGAAVRSQAPTGVRLRRASCRLREAIRSRSAAFSVFSSLSRLAR